MATDDRRNALLDKIGIVWALGTFVVAAAFDRASNHLALAGGDGAIRLAPVKPVQDVPAVLPVHAAHAGAVLSLVPDCRAGAFISGGDDGTIRRIAADGTIATVAMFAARWVDHLMAGPGVYAAGIGREIAVLDPAGQRDPLLFPLPSSAGGIALDPKGKRVAASHYGGVTLRWTAGGEQAPRSLGWRGSHLATSWSPDGRFIVTAMQENALHSWRVADGKDMRMSGYPVKVQSMSWFAKGRYLATSGSDRIVVWPFAGKDGPTGKPPLEMGHGLEGFVTRVAAHPVHDIVAAGYEDGAVILCQMGRNETLLVKRPGDGPVSALAWSPDGHHLAIGTEDGFAAVLSAADWRTN
ncbi:MAG: WD40 repeat domain-containing protein [Alphaproteobacteria bacterium]|nr:WD40 repeat domain-containing protein [Alphaproteobacteria bacterium]